MARRAVVCFWRCVSLAWTGNQGHLWDLDHDVSSSLSTTPAPVAVAAAAATASIAADTADGIQLNSLIECSLCSLRRRRSFIY